LRFVSIKAFARAYDYTIGVFAAHAGLSNNERHNLTCLLGTA